MKVALIGDVHANLPALKAVLKHARKRDVEAIWNIGDFVGYSPFPDEVVRRLRQEDALSVIGNHDLKVLRIAKNKNKRRYDKRPEKLASLQWTYDNLSPRSRRYLRSLPREVRPEVNGRRILLTHASPASIDESLRPRTSKRRLRKLAKKAKADVVIVGHSHKPFARQVDGVWFINTGSVGRPDDGDPRACYAILKLSSDGLKVKHYRVKYDVDDSVAAIRRSDLPEAFAQMLLLGRSLDWVLRHRKRWIDVKKKKR